MFLSDDVLYQLFNCLFVCLFFFSSATCRDHSGCYCHFHWSSLSAVLALYSVSLL